jgi:adenylate cyclase
MVRGRAAGADDFVSKPFIAAELIARVRSLLRVKRLYDQVQSQAQTIQQWNDDLQAKVSQQVEELERVRRVQRFLSPQIAQAVLADDGAILKSHRREICVIYLDLRGFTSFSETAEPEDVMQALSEYHAAMGTIAMQFNGTIERFTGDAIMVFLNDPIPIEQPAVVACEMANAMREAAHTLTHHWQQRGFTLGLGIGVAQGYATVGTIGFEARQDYAAIGSVTNLAARLCAEAQANEILMTERVFNGASHAVVAEPLGLVTLKGFSQPQSLMRLISFQRPD